MRPPAPPAFTAPCDDGTAGSGVLVSVHGARGSVPTPDAANAGYGGNTSCVQLVAPDGSSIILDAGTGIRAAAPAAGPGAEYDIVLTHHHLDHIQGLPFFPPIHDPAATVRIHAPADGGHGPRELLDDLAPAYFPVAATALPAAVSCHALEDGTRRIGAFRLRSLRVDHPSTTHGILLQCGAVRIAYVPDNELCGGLRVQAALADFVAGADLLIHDATLLDSELPQQRGWGHSSVEEAVRLACDAGVRQLLLFHHHPLRTDRAIDTIVAVQRERLHQRAVPLLLDAAREGHALSVCPAAAAVAR